jgi:hypothetical protein
MYLILTARLGGSAKALNEVSASNSMSRDDIRTSCRKVLINLALQGQG